MCLTSANSSHLFTTEPTISAYATLQNQTAATTKSLPPISFARSLGWQGRFNSPHVVLIPGDLATFLHFPCFERKLQLNQQYQSIRRDIQGKANEEFDNACWKAYKSAVLRRILWSSYGTTEPETSFQAHAYLALSVEDWFTTPYRTLYDSVAAYHRETHQVALWIPENIQVGGESVSITIAVSVDYRPEDSSSLRLASIASENSAGQTTIHHGVCYDDIFY